LLLLLHRMRMNWGQRWQWGAEQGAWLLLHRRMRMNWGLLVG
jgi:hypothetical protein